MISRLVPGTSALCMIVRLTGEGWTGEGCGCALSDSSIANVMRAVQSVILLNMVHSCSMACADPCGLDNRTPLVDFRLKQPSQPFGRRAFDNDTEWLEPGLDRGFG